jgi:hypothetical protein
MKSWQAQQRPFSKSLCTKRLKVFLCTKLLQLNKNIVILFIYMFHFLRKLELQASIRALEEITDDFLKWKLEVVLQWQDTDQQILMTVFLCSMIVLINVGNVILLYPVCLTTLSPTFCCVLWVIKAKFLFVYIPLWWCSQ